MSNDDSSIGFSLRRPSRAERAVDDPIREMEGMLVDEYGRSEFHFTLSFLPYIIFLICNTIFSCILFHSYLFIL